MTDRSATVLPGRALVAALAAVVLLPACGGLATSTGDGLARARWSQPSQAPEGFWEQWADGRAELAGYQLTQARYGELRQGEAVLVTVTETFAHGPRVKSDGGHPDEYPVIKLNEVRDFQTGIYDYNLMTSTFLPLDGRTSRGLPTKLSFSMQEWCGHVYEQLVVDPAGAGLQARHVGHSYFDGEADRQEVLDLPEGTVALDAMPLLVRGLVGELVAPGQSVERPAVDRLQDLRMQHRPLRLQTARITRQAEPVRVEVPAGAYEVERWTVEAGGLVTTFEVDVQPPHVLVGWTRSDGERGALTGVERRRYWQEQGEGDEALRASLGLPQAERR